MRAWMVVVVGLGVGCGESPGHHFDAVVSVTLVQQTTAMNAVVTVAAEGYVPKVEGSALHEPLTGIAARLELDGAVIDLAEATPGHYESAPHMGFPTTIRLHLEDEVIELAHVPIYVSWWEGVAGRVRVSVDRAITAEEEASVSLLGGNPPVQINRQMFAGATSLEMPYASGGRILVQRMLTTEADVAGLVLEGKVSVKRELPL